MRPRLPLVVLPAPFAASYRFDWLCGGLAGAGGGGAHAAVLVGVCCYVCDELLGREGEEAGEGEGGGGGGEAGEEEVVVGYCVGDLGEVGLVGVFWCGVVARVRGEGGETNNGSVVVHLA